MPGGWVMISNLKGNSMLRKFLADADTVLVRRHWRFLRHRQQQQTGIAVFIIPGLYWGPAWWDPAYTKLCWKKIRCRDCADNWIYVC
jgi:hypothetical protein